MTTALEGGEWSAARPGRTLPPGKTRYPLYRRLGGPQGRSGRAENLAPAGFHSRNVQPVVSRYTDLATRATCGINNIRNPEHGKSLKPIKTYRYCWITCIRCLWLKHSYTAQRYVHTSAPTDISPGDTAVKRPAVSVNPYPTAFPYGNGMVLHFYQQQESSTTKTVHKVINKGLKTYV